MAHANVLGVLLMIELIINFNYATLLLLQYSSLPMPVYVQLN